MTTTNSKSTNFFRYLKQNANITAVAMPEDIPIEGNASASDYPEEDQKVNDWIYDQLNSGNEWAWCMVKVTAEYDCKEGKDYLGACSYENKENFIKGGYYDDMVDSAIEDLIRIMDEIPEEAIDSETCKQCKGFGTSGKPGEASECKRCFGYGRMYYLRHPETTQ